MAWYDSPEYTMDRNAYNPSRGGSTNVFGTRTIGGGSQNAYAGLQGMRPGAGGAGGGPGGFGGREGYIQNLVAQGQRTVPAFNFYNISQGDLDTAWRNQAQQQQADRMADTGSAPRNPYEMQGKWWNALQEQMQGWEQQRQEAIGMFEAARQQQMEQERIAREHNEMIKQEALNTLNAMAGNLRRGGQGSLYDFMQGWGQNVAGMQASMAWAPGQGAQYTAQAAAGPGSTYFQQPDYSMWMDPATYQKQWSNQLNPFGAMQQFWAA